MPGKPLLETLELTGLENILQRLYTLSYIRNNAIKTTMLLFPLDWSIDQIVKQAKEYCAGRNVTFSWIELSIIEVPTGDR